MSIDKADVEKRKAELLEKLKQETITPSEAAELKIMLEQEKEIASKQGNAALVVSIAILLGLLVKYLSDEKIFDKITKFFSGKNW